MTSLQHPGKHLQPTAPKLPLGLLHAKHHDPAKWQRERHQAWMSKIWVPILANTGSVKDPTHSAAGRAHCDVKFPAQSTETSIISPSAHLCQHLGTETFPPCPISKFGSPTNNCDWFYKCPDKSNKKVNCVMISDWEILVFIYL